MGRNRGPSVKKELIAKSREAALNAVQTFNNPLTKFKAETFIVLMVIAWTYLLHAYFRQSGIEYRYYETGLKRRKFIRINGRFKYWELTKCLRNTACPLDRPTKLNLEFLIGLRNEIEHHWAVGVNERFSGRYLACCLNYERYICDLFGSKHSIDSVAAFTLQFRDLKEANYDTQDSVVSLPSRVAQYVAEFDSELSEEDLKSPHFRRRFLFAPIVTSKKAQADEVIQFVPLDSSLGTQINEKYQQIVLKEVERPKRLPSEIVSLMNEEGYKKFNMHHHTMLWKSLEGKNPGKGFGVEVAGYWYWYDRWLDTVRQHCASNRSKYEADFA